MFYNNKGEPVVVVGIHGAARSGKDTLARMLQENLTLYIPSDEDGPVPPCGFFALTMSLAAPLKEMIASLISWAYPSLHEDGLDFIEAHKEDEVFLGESPRYLLQTLGTEWGRKYLGEDIWARVLISRAADLTATSWPLAYRAIAIIVPDVRFLNESKYTDILIRISRKDAERVREHVSEAGIASAEAAFDYEVCNDGDLDDLRDTARSLADAIAEKLVETADKERARREELKEVIG